MAIQPETLDDHDDHRAVAAFQEGDANAFARIVEVHYASLMADARRRLHSTGDAEDAVQETLLRAYLALDRFGGEYRLRAWLGRILANVCADLQYRRGADIRLRGRLASRREIVPGADDVLTDAGVRRALADALSQLPDSYRSAFVLREVQEHSYADMAQEMAVSEVNARARVHRARGVLKGSLRGLSDTLGGFALPVRFLPWHLLSRTRWRLRQAPITEASSTPPQTVLVATTSSSPLVQISQALTQVASSPLSQTIVAVAPDAGRASLPVAGTIATLAAAGVAMVGAGTGALAQPAASPAVTLVAAAPGVASSTYVDSPPGNPRASYSLAGGPSAASPAASSSSSSATAPSDPTSSLAPPGGSQAWKWVAGAAAASVSPGSGGTEALAAPGSSANAASSTSASSTSASPNTSTSPQDPSSSSFVEAQGGGASPAEASCPYANAFPGAAPGAVVPSAPELEAGLPSAYFSTPLIAFPGPGQPFGFSDEGIASDAVGSAEVEMTLGACVLGTSEPMLVVNLNNPQSPYILQLRGGEVGTFSSDSSFVTYFRGEGFWLSGPDVGSAPVPFVAQLVTPSVGQLLIAFFGSISDLLSPSSTTPMGSSCSADVTPSASASETSSNSDPNTSASPDSAQEPTSPGNGTPDTQDNCATSTVGDGSATVSTSPNSQSATPTTAANTTQSTGGS